MYTINLKTDNSNGLEYIEIENTSIQTSAKIYTSLGASLQALTLNGKQIITALDPLPYSDTYASSILFPFANRIDKGAYSFEGKTFQFPINEPGNNNALHGLVFNKTFKLIKQVTDEHQAAITLEYVEENVSKGFPYTFTIQLEYVLTANSLDLNVSVKNTDSKTFPFTLGWHPYFESANLFDSTLKFDSNKQLTFNDRCITTGTKDVSGTERFEIKDKYLDDCFLLNHNNITFNTPEYSFVMSSSSKESFLQIYTPPKKTHVAIEPTTGVSNSFNNVMGLQTLKPNETYHLNWNIKLQ
ncbi:aldose 1-epimerase [Aestuariibaculum suncheonense]|uniref:Aldose 1-epimerase n=1 Tax=Aestuariibaculum suncheonense TaxID=1028745 RepID=A0A8J6Q864_9FLAO|nr:aldose 1-epimerase [Aestuariibaculum suncheonense]MBD0835777.1 aldose 1-epimerase [Aestuariibaculum suncheonense]